MEVLQTSALPLGDGAADCLVISRAAVLGCYSYAAAGLQPRAIDGAGNGIRTRDFDLGKVALYH